MDIFKYINDIVYWMNTKLFNNLFDKQEIAIAPKLHDVNNSDQLKILNTPNISH